MRLVYLFSLFFTHSAFALQVMTFNTMCDFCTGSNYWNFEARVKQIRKVISTYNPELIALQEVRTVSQLKDIIKNTQYEYIASEYFLMSYADPAILFDKTKFKLESKTQFWLGPKDSLNFGWSFALPRQAHTATLVEIKTGKKFIFATAHFDNKRKNLMGAAKKINQKLKEQELPVIFAADTNITPDTRYYQELTKELFTNSFEIKKNFAVKGKYKSDKDLCYYRKGDQFPNCRVDHILLSSNHTWDVEGFIIDAQKFEEKYPSDHRAVIIQLQGLP